MAASPSFEAPTVAERAPTAFEDETSFESASADPVGAGPVPPPVNSFASATQTPDPDVVPATQVAESLEDTLEEPLADDLASRRIAQANAAPTGQPVPVQTASNPVTEPASLTTPETVQTAAAIAPSQVQPIGANAASQPKRTGIFSFLQRTPPKPVGSVPGGSVGGTDDDAPVLALARGGSVQASTQISQEAARSQRIVATARTAGASASALPGVDRDRALGVAQSDESDDRPSTGIQVASASAAGLARLAPNGLRTQHDGVDVKCLKPALVRVLKQVESRYGKPVVVTSGYRSPTRNQKASGAKQSLHMYCAAADIQVEGVSKWTLAKFLRDMPGRGGVGTYCHTESVHIDIGPRRDWNWRCRRGR